jgi:cyanophycin synthetase
MFAAAMAFSLGISLDHIRQGLRTFDTTFFQAPGRMNVFDGHNFKVILDYGHNAAAVAAMADLAHRLDVQGRRIVVLSAPGDRRDEDIAAVAQAAAGKFDYYICRRDDSLRGRAPDEVPRMLEASLRAHGVSHSSISVIPEETKAVEAALQMGRQGDFILIFADILTRSWKQVTKFKGDESEEEGIVARVALSSSAADSDESLPEAPLEEGWVREERGVRFVSSDRENRD